jgi:hypothetical protein
MKMYGEVKLQLHRFIFGIRWRLVVSFMPLTLSPWGRIGCCVDLRLVSPCRYSNPALARDPFPIPLWPRPTELSWLKK